LAGWQAQLQGAVKVPVMSSSLLACAQLPRSGIVTFDAASLHPLLLRLAGVPVGTPVEGLEPGCALQTCILADKPELDLAQAERDVVAAAQRLVARYPQLQSVVLECTNMPPYRLAVEQAIQRPVHDLETQLIAAWRRVQSSSTRLEG
jgi:hypothetical protein